MYLFPLQCHLTQILNSGKSSVLGKVRALLALLVSLLGMLLVVPAATAAASPTHLQARVTVDGVTLNVQSPILPASQFSAPLPDQSSQQAIMTSISPYREVSIMAVPLGTTSEFDGIAATASGGAAAYRQALGRVRALQNAKWLRGPTASIYGQQVLGSAAFVELPLHGTRTEPAVVVEWVSEAGARVWIVRVVVEAAYAQTQSGGVQGFVDTLAQVHLTSTSLGAPSTLLRALSVHRASTSPTTVASSPTATRRTQAVAPATTLPFPSWWNGNCDVNAHGSPTSYPLGDSYEGMPACGPRPAFDSCGSYCDYQVQFYPGAWGELEWECVELVMRYMYLGYGVNPYPANGNQVVANYSGSALSKVSNGSGQAPVPGDVISFNSSGAAGHTALVASSSVSNGNGTIYVLQQNFGGNGYGNSNDLMPMTVSGGVLQDLNGLHATGWLDSGSSSSGRIGYVNTSNDAYVNEGAVNAGFTLEAHNAKAIALSGTRIGYLDTSGDFYVKDGTLGAGWTLEAHNVIAMALISTRIGYVNTSNDAYVNEGAVNAGFTLEAHNAKAIALSGTRIGYLHTSGDFYVKDGTLGAGWTLEAHNAAAIALSGTRIGYLDTSGNFYAKDGTLGAGWYTLVTGVATAIALPTT